MPLPVTKPTLKTLKKRSQKSKTISSSRKSRTLKTPRVPPLTAPRSLLEIAASVIQLVRSKGEILLEEVTRHVPDFSSHMPDVEKLHALLEESRIYLLEDTLVFETQVLESEPEPEPEREEVSSAGELPDVLHSFMSRIGDVPLLSREEEAALGKRRE